MIAAIYNFPAASVSPSRRTPRILFSLALDSSWFVAAGPVDHDFVGDCFEKLIVHNTLTFAEYVRLLKCADHLQDQFKAHVPGIFPMRLRSLRYDLSD